MAYHFNPDTGKTGKCSSDPSNPNARGCDFAVDGITPEHFSTEEEARKAAEVTLKAKHDGVSTLSKKKDPASNINIALEKEAGFKKVGIANLSLEQHEERLEVSKALIAHFDAERKSNMEAFENYKNSGEKGLFLLSAKERKDAFSRYPGLQDFYEADNNREKATSAFGSARRAIDKMKKAQAPAAPVKKAEIKGTEKQAFDAISSLHAYASANSKLSKDSKSQADVARLTDIAQYEGASLGLRKRALLAATAEVINSSRGDFMSSSNIREFERIRDAYSSSQSTVSKAGKDAFYTDMSKLAENVKKSSEREINKRNSQQKALAKKQERIEESKRRSSITDSQYVSKTITKGKDYQSEMQKFIESSSQVREVQPTGMFAVGSKVRYAGTYFTSEGDSVSFEGWNSNDKVGVSINGKRFSIERDEKGEWGEPKPDTTSKFYVKSYGEIQDNKKIRR